MERHRAGLNAYLAHDPKLLEGAFAFLLNTPRLIDFANKVAYFRAKVTELKGRERMAPVSIAIHRSRAFEESFRQLKPKPAAEMRGPLQVRFPGCMHQLPAQRVAAGSSTPAPLQVWSSALESRTSVCMVYIQ